MLWKRAFEDEKNSAEAGAQPASAESDRILFFDLLKLILVIVTDINLARYHCFVN